MTQRESVAALMAAEAHRVDCGECGKTIWQFSAFSAGLEPRRYENDASRHVCKSRDLKKRAG